MSPTCLPLNTAWQDEDAYVTSLLSFATGSDIFRNLCGGIHILDFLTREPDLYSTVLPQDWRDWFELVNIDNVLDLLLRTSLDQPDVDYGGERAELWPGHPCPPQTLFDYVSTIRKHCLLRQHIPVSDKIETMPRHMAVGMKPKKIHEVSNFAAYVDKLSRDLAENSGQSISGIVDFGSGQNYLGRTLASPPYNRDVVAIERKHHNINGARGMDVYAKLAKKQKIMRNKKEYKKQLLGQDSGRASPTDPRHLPINPPNLEVVVDTNRTETAFELGRGSMTYVEHDIQDGHLESILYPKYPVEHDGQEGHLESILYPCPDAIINHSSTIEDDTGIGTPLEKQQSSEGTSSSPDHQPQTNLSPPNLMVISLHSCGNLVHHGLRSLVLNPSVSAVAMIGCCYNLMTERLGPPTYKLPTLRSLHPRLESTSTTFDPHGFPMSQKLETFNHKHGQGVRLNITARMMAVQAPYNWGPEDSKAFFTRHFYRALLQRILLDRGVVKQSNNPDSIAGGSISGKDNAGTPLIVGALRKHCFESFRAYVRCAITKLAADPVDGPMIREHTSDLTDDIIDKYEADWDYAKKNLSVIWSLMAFSAGVVESIIAVDRWLFLREQDCVEKCWVEPVFDYGQSPRNLVVVGVKKR